eukprot:2259486-Rhodomonas_salina.1
MPCSCPLPTRCLVLAVSARVSSTRARQLIRKQFQNSAAARRRWRRGQWLAGVVAEVLCACAGLKAAPRARGQQRNLHGLVSHATKWLATDIQHPISTLGAQPRLAPLAGCVALAGKIERAGEMTALFHF